VALWCGPVGEGAVVAVAVPVDDLGGGAHACLTFSDEEERLDIVAAFVADGLERGQQVICYTDTDSPAKLCEQLTEREVAAHAAAGAGQLQVHTIEQRWLTDGGFSPEPLLRLLSEQVTAAERDGFTGLRVTSDMSWPVRPCHRWAADLDLPVRPAAVRRGHPGRRRPSDHTEELSPARTIGVSSGAVPR
jgi:hypothetical protein